MYMYIIILFCLLIPTASSLINFHVNQNSITATPLEARLRLEVSKVVSYWCSRIKHYVVELMLIL